MCLEGFHKFLPLRLWKKRVPMTCCSSETHFLSIRGAFKLSGILIFFSGMEADRNVKVVGGDLAVLQVGRGQVATLYYPLNTCDEVELQ